MPRSADDSDDEADLASGTFVRRPWSSLSSSRHCCCHRTVVVVSAPIDPHLDKRTNIDEDGQRFPHDFSAISSRFSKNFDRNFPLHFMVVFPMILVGCHSDSRARSHHYVFPRFSSCLSLTTTLAGGGGKLTDMMN